MLRSTMTVASAVLCLLLALALSRAEDVSRTIYVPEGWEGAYEFGYAPVLRVGETVIVSGVPASGGGTYEEKIHGMYTRVRELLASAGATIDDVVELTTFHAEPKEEPAAKPDEEKKPEESGSPP